MTVLRLSARWSRAKLADGRLTYSLVGHSSWCVKREADSAYGWMLTRDGRPYRSTTALRNAKALAEACEREYLAAGATIAGGTR